MVYKVSVRPWSASIFSIVFCKHCKHWSTSSVLSSLSMPSTSSCLIWASSALDCETHNMISGPLSAFDPRHTFLFHQNMFTVNLPWRRNSSDCPGFPIGFQAAWVNYKFIVTKQSFSSSQQQNTKRDHLHLSAFCWRSASSSIFSSRRRSEFWNISSSSFDQPTSLILSLSSPSNSLRKACSARSALCTGYHYMIYRDW